jgi:hypothetical protein
VRSSLAVLLRSLAVVIVSLGLAACASSGGDVPVSGTADVYNQLQTDYGIRSMSLRTVEDVYVRGDTLAYEGDDLFRHLAATYDEMGIPLNEVNAENRLLGAVEARLRGDLGGRPISRYFRCGTSITGSIADQYEVYLTVITQLESVEAGGTGVFTHARAFAVQGGRSGNDIRCATRARLEREIAEHLERKVASQG